MNSSLNCVPAEKCGSSNRKTSGCGYVDVVIDLFLNVFSHADLFSAL